MAKDEMKTKLRLQVLSPIHIGTGEKLSLWDFALRSNYMFAIRVEEVLEDLYNKDKSRYEDALSKLEKGEGKIDEFLPNRIPEEWIIYRMELHPSINTEKIKEISTAVKNIGVNLRPKLYIPASTIKGFVRTAIIYRYIRDNFNEFAEKFKQINRKFSFKKVVENKILDDPSKDPMKYLHIEDIYGDLHGQIVGVKILLSSKSFWVENVEAISKGRSEAFTIKTVINDNNGILSKRIGKYIIEWKKCCYEFSKDIIEAEVRFWEDLLKDEKGHAALISKLGRLSREEFNDIVNRIRKLNNRMVKGVINQLKEIGKENTEDTPVMRIGKFTGYMSHTVGVLLNRNVDKYKHADQPYNIAPIGGDIGAKNAQRFLFPLTRRLTLDGKILGWCRLVPEGSINRQGGE